MGGQAMHAFDELIQLRVVRSEMMIDMRESVGGK